MPVKITTKKISPKTSRKVGKIVNHPYQYAPVWEESRAIHQKSKCPHREGVIQGSPTCTNCKYNRVRTITTEHEIGTCGCVAASWIRRLGDEVNTKVFTMAEWSRNVMPKKEGGVE